MNDIFTDRKRFGIYGPSECGKTTLAKKIVKELYRREGRWAIVLDPVEGGNWGEHAQVFSNEASFLQHIQVAKNCLVVMDDASVTVAGDKDKDFVFTTLRHQGHKLLICGHRPTNLGPSQRENLQMAFCFRLTPDSLDYLSQQFSRTDFAPVLSLQQFQFAVLDPWSPLKIYQLTR